MSEDKFIRFTDSGNNTLFRIPDGANIILSYDDGFQQIMPCRYIDEYHVQVGNAYYHICQFADNMETAEIRFGPEIPQPLPKHCYSTLPSTGELILITKDESTYQKCSFSLALRELNEMMASALNEQHGVSRQQEAAMLGGSMFGWSTPAAQTSSYDFHGEPIKPIKPVKKKEKSHRSDDMAR